MLYVRFADHITGHRQAIDLGGSFLRQLEQSVCHHDAGTFSGKTQRQSFTDTSRRTGYYNGFIVHIHDRDLPSLLS